MAEARRLDSGIQGVATDELRSSASDDLLRELADTGAAPLAVELAPGERIDRFRIEGVIGRGGMGVVYDAHDERLDRRVALKLLHAHLVGQTERRRRFAREARAAAAITHPNVARILEVGDGDAGAYLVFEKVEGRTLRAALREGPMRIEQIVEIGARIASGLVAAHAAGIVHRDLKPENVIVDARGDVKILDFGLAKTTASREAHEREGEILTTEGVVVGSPGYMSPEQALGKQTAEPTDVFSLGVLLFELATRSRPFKGGTTMESIVATSRDEAPDPHELRRDLPRAFARLVKRCLAKEPERRPSAAEVEAALRALPSEPAPRGLLVPALALGALSIAVVIAALSGEKRATVRAGEAIPGEATAPTAAVSVSASALAPSSSAWSSAPSSEPSSRREPAVRRGPSVPRVAPSAAVAASSPAVAPPPPSPSDDPSFSERK